MGTHLRVLSESYQMNINMTVIRWLSKIFASMFFGQKVASALEGLTQSCPWKLKLPDNFGDIS